MTTQPLTAQDFTHNPLALRNLRKNSRYLHENKDL